MMIWRLILLIFSMVVILLFIGFNWNNRSDISFGFKVLEDIPVVLTAFTAFIAGMLCSFPFFLGFLFRGKPKKGGARPAAKPAKKPDKEKQDNKKQDKPEKDTNAGTGDAGGGYGID